MKLRTALLLGIAFGLAALVAFPSAGVDVIDVDWVVAIDLTAKGADGTRADAGWGHWITGGRRCQVEPWWTPGPIAPCGAIYIGWDERAYHIVAVYYRAPGDGVVYAEPR
ncbi:MAG: hypothetical protein AAGN66_13655 [Acidobacteriota bacterium]